MSIYRRMFLILAVLSLAMLLSGCTQTVRRQYLFDGRVACEETDCSCGSLAISTSSDGDAIPPGEVIDEFINEDSLVEVEAVAEPGWTFTHWSGDVSGTDETAEILIDRGKDITAHFERVRPLRTLEIRVIGEGGVDCGACCPLSTRLEGGSLRTPGSAQFGDGTVLRLTAYSAPGWAVESWSGFESGIDEIELVMNRDRSVTVLFVDQHDHP